MPQGPMGCKTGMREQSQSLCALWIGGSPRGSVVDRLAEHAKLPFHFPLRRRYSLMSDKPRQKAPSRSEAARARSAAALRENLKRRKAQARDQAEDEKKPASRDDQTQ